MTEATAQEPDTCLDTATRLADLTTMRVGGPAQRIVTAHDADELVAAVQAALDGSTAVTRHWQAGPASGTAAPDTDERHTP